MVLLDVDYARAVQEASADPPRLDDALARLDAGQVRINHCYQQDNPARSGTLLTFAVLDDLLLLVEALLARGARPDFREDLPQEGAVAPAVFYVRSAQVLEALVRAGADLNVSHNGEPLLHRFIRMTRLTRHPIWIQLARAALRLGADPSHRDVAGMDAAEFARSMGASVAKTYASLLGGPVGSAAGPAARAVRKPSGRSRPTTRSRR